MVVNKIRRYEMEITRNLLGKISFKGEIICKTGLHIGASKETMEIGAIDAPVVRDPVSNRPYIPGSSLKGKMRALLEKALATQDTQLLSKRHIGSDVNIHVCRDAQYALECPLCRIFGSTGDKGGKNFPARLMVRDAYLTEESAGELGKIDTGPQYTEWKFENAIDRVTSAANPRQLERVPKGAVFDFEMIYNIEDEEHVEEDLKNLHLALELLQHDALGGHGSRGYGKIEIRKEAILARPIDYFKGKKDEERSLDSLKDVAPVLEMFKS